MNPFVLLEKKGSIAEIQLNRPDAMNSFNLELIDQLYEAVKGCADPSIRVVVLKGNGRCFSAGGDIKFFQQLLKEGSSIPSEMPDRLHRMIEELRNLEKPVVASVHGAAAGAGTSLVLACDLVIASEEAVFNLAYTRIGLSPDGSSTYFLPRHLGLKKAMEIFLMTPTLTAREAQLLGLINWVVPASELVKKTDEITGKLSAGPTQAYAKTKRLVNLAAQNSLHDQLAEETRAICDSSRTSDFREGLAAFLEKRDPQFRGS